MISKIIILFWKAQSQKIVVAIFANERVVLWSKEKMIDLLTAIGLSTGGISIVHIYTQSIHIITQITTEKHK
jgi:hypothetical protein